MGQDDIPPQDLRQMLAERLRTDVDFDAFCLDAFPGIHRRFGRGMDRVEKENLLLVLAPSRADVVAALRKRSPLGAAHAPRSVRILVGGLLGAVLVAGIAWQVRSSRMTRGQDAGDGTRAVPTSACGALMIDDVFVAKEAGASSAQPIFLDVRLRHGGSGAAPVNVTRAVVECGDKVPERAPYEPSASYDLLISGAHNEAPIAQRLSAGEIDRMLIRLGFTNDSAGYEYTAKLKLVYNGSCAVESAPFALSRAAARYVGFLR